MKLITVTLSPVYDIFYNIPSFTAGGENSAESVSRFVGGKGINVSRALKSYGYNSMAVMLLGRDNSDGIINQTKSAGLDTSDIFCDGFLRENITILSENGETRINSDSFYCSEEDLERVLREVKRFASEDSIIVCSGRFPRGVCQTACEDFVSELLKMTSYVALDSASLSGEAVFRLKPWLIKPNKHELFTLFGIEIKEIADAVSAVRLLCRNGIKNAMLSLGGDGAAYSGELGTAFAEVPEITPKSTVGAGDSTVAGFVSAYSVKRDLAFCLSRACAFGSAACLTDGTNPPLRNDIDTIQKQIKLHICKNSAS